MANKEAWKEEVLSRLRHLDPRVKTLPCNDDGGNDKTVAYVPAARVCYFTTRTEREGLGATGSARPQAAQVGLENSLVRLRPPGRTGEAFPGPATSARPTPPARHGRPLP